MHSLLQETHKPIHGSLESPTFCAEVDCGSGNQTRLITVVTGAAHGDTAGMGRHEFFTSEDRCCELKIDTAVGLLCVDLKVT